MRVAARGLVVVLMSLVAWAPSSYAEEEEKKDRSYRGGALRLGAFWVFQIDTVVAAKSSRFPLGIHIDLSTDLGVSDSATVPRAMFTYRFSKRSQLDFDWFRINRTGGKRLDRTINIGRREFEIGIGVDAFTDVSIYKTVYTWVFYDSSKVKLGLSGGLHIVDFEVGIDAGPDRIGDFQRSERAGITAPLPVFGGRLDYQVSPKIGVLFTADFLMVKYGNYSGTFQDVYAFVEYRVSKRFGFGGGLNVLSLDVDMDDDVIAELNHTLTGVAVYGAVYF